MGPWRGYPRAFAVRAAASGQLVGSCELRGQPEGGWGRVSYSTHANQRGRGYASRALGLLRRYALSIGIARLESHVAEDDMASRRVSEKAGFLLSGRFTAEDGTRMLCYRAWGQPAGAEGLRSSR